DKIKLFAQCNPCAEQDRIKKKEKRLKEKLLDETISPLSLSKKTPINEDNSDSNKDKPIYNMCDLEEF
ncbi:11265_t:CDS:1, partial [Racocetra persica]